jgi:hypothetical protein
MQVRLKRDEAAARLSQGDRAGTAAILGEREQILRQTAQTLGEPGLVRDAERLAMMLETAGRSHLR